MRRTRPDRDHEIGTAYVTVRLVARGGKSLTRTYHGVTEEAEVFAVLDARCEDISLPIPQERKVNHAKA